MKGTISRVLKCLKRLKRPKCSKHPSAPDVVARDANSTLRVVSPILKAYHNYSELEKLPPELRRHILSFLDLQSLASLIRASPTMLQQYLEDRRYVLCASLDITLGILTPDAQAVLKSNSYTVSCTRDQIAQFLESYRLQSPSQPLYKQLDEAEALQMAKFHSAIVCPLLRQFTNWALTNLAAKTGCPPNDIILSAVEKTRIFRSLYRFQLCCNLFGHGAYGRPWDSSPYRPEWEHFQILRMFLCLFEPWEIEEIVCVNSFTEDIYNRVLDAIEWDLSPENPRFDDCGRPPTPEGAFELDDSFVRMMLLSGTTSRGLGLLHKIIFQIKDHEHLVSTMQEQMKTGEFFDESNLSQACQRCRRDEEPSERDLKQERLDPLLFVGDIESQPPLAWTLIWGDTYSNIYGHYISDEFRKWAYVMWDKTRLEREGATDELLREWEARWGGQDPRDFMRPMKWKGHQHEV
ncbi:uncharacterized protein F4822DRAFT_388120 [Hypoxylon trugodes]|uniref:uncharacterized protein n=1 Tax=Hypoxylon trugodes TaxID=326681 RepID=UPI00219ABFC2|nr:uncharacterized protein F4822DRAFT_388120 [Hypoxylon trugodes]KAI1394417.1 hypothetical protein F4822DRAFT_388120 [Hypoxylon trugodes]